MLKNISNVYYSVHTRILIICLLEINIAPGRLCDVKPCLKVNRITDNNGQKKKYKRTNNDLQNIHIQTKNWIQYAKAMVDRKTTALRMHY
jgi:hypothetical protein